MTHRFNRILTGDCIEGMRQLPERSADLVFADPPFNIGYSYDQYNDRRPAKEYLDWSREWMTEVKRLLQPSGSLWLAIGDEYAAELKVLATRDLGFVCRSWVIWYYTFGVHCESKFTRSHTHLFHFVCDPKNFIFNNAAIRVPSARQLIYADKRANPEGRVPDDTWIIRPAMSPSWILRPQDLPEGFSADSDTWHFPRVCGTFRERMGFHGCQMPEQLLGRIIESGSNEGDVVFDPFVGSGTTLAVAKKLQRRFLGFELSPDYAEAAQKRIDAARAGSPLNGAEHPHAPKLHKARPTRPRARRDSAESNGVTRRPARVRGLLASEQEIAAAFDKAGRGFSADRVVADPEINAEFGSILRSRGIDGDLATWNLALLRLRKANRLKPLGPTKRTKLDQAKLDKCEFAAEIALRQMQDRLEVTLDALLCAPILAQEFDQLASEICKGFEPLYYRWAALRLRKYAKKSREVGQRFADQMPTRFPPLRKLELSERPRIQSVPGIYALSLDGKIKYFGDSGNLAEWFDSFRHDQNRSSKLRKGSSLSVSVLPIPVDDSALSESDARKGAKSVKIKCYQPSWNLLELAI